MNFRLITLFFLIAITVVNADYNKNTLFDALIKKYSNLSSMSASFNDEGREITGTIKAAKGNKYYIKTGNRTIISDGITIWNYDAGQKKVIINKAEAGASGTSVDKIFFNFINNYQPAAITNNDYGYTLELTKKNSKNENADKLFLWIEGKTLDIFRVQLNGETTVNSWGLVGLKLNKKFRNNTFSFKVPPGTEVIDMR